MRQGTIVIPCYNEADRLDVDQFVRYVLTRPSFHLLFVNDGSRDRTLDVLRDLCTCDPDRCTVLHLEDNVGKAEAVRRGILSALRQHPEYVGYWDADLATPLGAIDDFCAVLIRHPELELVMGARVRLLGRSIERQPIRHYLGRVFAAAASLALRLPVYDTQCGAKLFRVTDTTERIFASPFVSNWIFDVEILARMTVDAQVREGRPMETVIYEYPLCVWHDVAGSKVRVKDFLKAALELMAIYRRYMRGVPKIPSTDSQSTRSNPRQDEGPVVPDAVGGGEATSSSPHAESTI